MSASAYENLFNLVTTVIPIFFFLAAFGLMGLYFGVVWLRNSRIIEDVATSKVRSAAQGYVELEGTARAFEGVALFSPLTQQACVWWSYQIEKKIKTGDKTKWKLIEEKCSDTPFYLDDATGRCTILPSGAEVTTKIMKVWFGNSDWPLDATSGSEQYRYTEILIEPESHVYAIGSFDSRHPVSALSDQDAASRTTEHGSGTAIKDLIAARKTARQELQTNDQTGAADGTHTLSFSSGRNHPFIISSLPQKELAKDQRQNAYISIAISGVCTVVFVVFFFGGEPKSESEKQWKTEEPTLEEASQILLKISPAYGLQLQAPPVLDYAAEGWTAVHVGELTMYVPPGWTLIEQETREEFIPSATLSSPDKDAQIELRFHREEAITPDNPYGENAFSQTRLEYEGEAYRKGEGTVLGYAPMSVDGCFGFLRIMNMFGKAQNDDGTPTLRMNTYYGTKRVGESIHKAEFTAYFAQADQDKFGPIILNTIRTVRFANTRDGGE